MISAYLIENFLHILLIVIAFFIIIKFIVLLYNGVRTDRFSIFLITLGLMSRQTIRNTDSKSLKSYYRVSNTVNKFFYIILLSFCIFCGFVFLIKG